MDKETKELLEKFCKIWEDSEKYFDTSHVMLSLSVLYDDIKEKLNKTQKENR